MDVSTYQCSDCASWWESQAARDECQIMDAAEARDARRPSTRTVRRVERWDND